MYLDLRPRVRGSFWKEFDFFQEGFESLCRVSGSARQALNHWRHFSEFKNSSLEDEFTGLALEAEAVRNLGANAISDRLTGNGVGWGRCSLLVSGLGVRYSTTACLEFGWNPNPNEWWREGGPEHRWTFFLIHPDGVDIREESSLRQAALAEGWVEGTYIPKA